MSTFVVLVDIFRSVAVVFSGCFLSLILLEILAQPLFDFSLGVFAFEAVAEIRPGTNFPLEGSLLSVCLIVGRVVLCELRSGQPLGFYASI